MSKHTPGPWEVERHTAHSGTVATVYGNGGWWEVWSRNDPGQPEANARLIVAAPELLEALEELVRINEEHNAAVEAVTGRPLNWKDTYLDRARAALARARGES